MLFLFLPFFFAYRYAGVRPPMSHFAFDVPKLELAGCCLVCECWSNRSPQFPCVSLLCPYPRSSFCSSPRQELVLVVPSQSGMVSKLVRVVRVLSPPSCSSSGSTSPISPIPLTTQRHRIGESAFIPTNKSACLAQW
ncbi:hypothetical protein GE09DRAFT_114086 [Coniochaeta sp. 2T2.1]|nr:hypothetical protein GE09DRAFT_114086 [Coniochaeta sp. 2T2.1]